MELGKRVRQWWNRLRGHAPPPARPNPPRSDRVGAHSADPDSTVTDASGTFKLSVEGEPDRKTHKRSSAGFDPYSSDGGFAKPSGWDNISRK